MDSSVKDWLWWLEYLANGISRDSFRYTNIETRESTWHIGARKFRGINYSSLSGILVGEVYRIAKELYFHVVSKIERNLFFGQYIRKPEMLVLRRMDIVMTRWQGKKTSKTVLWLRVVRKTIFRSVNYYHHHFFYIDFERSCMYSYNIIRVV